jgi:hypothetical protein
MDAVFVGVRHQGIGNTGNGVQYRNLTKHDRRQRAFGTFIHRALSAVDVQGAMCGVMAILTVVVGLLLLVSAKHAGILPESMFAKAEAREATQRQAGLDASSPGLTFEAARWRAFLDSLER